MNSFQSPFGAGGAGGGPGDAFFEDKDVHCWFADNNPEVCGNVTGCTYCTADKITNVTSQKLIDVTMREPGLKKLSGGRIFKVNTNKVPRIIGKKGSMVSMIKNATGCDITVGQNGKVWISGKDTDMEVKARKIIEFISENVLVPGLTEKVCEMMNA